MENWQLNVRQDSQSRGYGDIVSALLFFGKGVYKMFHDLFMIGCAFVAGGAAVIVAQYFRKK